MEENLPVMHLTGLISKHTKKSKVLGNKITQEISELINETDTSRVETQMINKHKR